MMGRPPAKRKPGRDRMGPMPLPALPTGVELDLLALGARQRARALGRGLGLLATSFCLLSASSILLLVAGGTLIAQGTSTLALAAAAGVLVVGGGAWLTARRALRHLQVAFGMRR